MLLFSFIFIILVANYFNRFGRKSSNIYSNPFICRPFYYTSALLNGFLIIFLTICTYVFTLSVCVKHVCMFIPTCAYFESMYIMYIIF